jgi:hypothetical protein
MEIINIFFQILIFITLSFFPSYYLFNSNKNLKELNIINFLGVNFLFVLNIILIFSFFNFNKEILFIFLLFLSVTSLFFFLIKSKKMISREYILLVFLLLLTFFISIDISNSFDFSWDSKKYYIPRAFAFFQSFFVDDLLKHTERPYYSTYIWSFFWKNSLIEYEYFGRMIYGYIYILSIFYLLSIKYFNWLTKIVFCLAIILLTYNSNFFDGRPDILMFSLFLFLSRELFKIFHERKVNFVSFIVLSLILNLILWTKSEGTVYILITFFSIIFFLKGNINFKIYLGISIIAMLVAKTIFYNYWGLSLNPNESHFSLSFINLLSIKLILVRTFQIFIWYFVYFFTNPIVILTLFVVVYLYFYDRKKIKNFSYIYCFLILKFLAIFLASIISVYELSLSFHLKYTLDRVILHSSGLLLIISISCLEKFKKDLP